ncbi:MAG: hypothetical protein H7Y00_11010 [Fimbriimonadaceae bacterium]|nr:hypothetical protein [Chitinophagales bacterium]
MNFENFLKGTFTSVYQPAVVNIGRETWCNDKVVFWNKQTLPLNPLDGTF